MHNIFLKSVSKVAENGTTQLTSSSNFFQVQYLSKSTELHQSVVDVT